MSFFESFSSFLAFYFLLLGLRMIFGGVHDPEILLGDSFASLARAFLLGRVEGKPQALADLRPATISLT